MDVTKTKLSFEETLMENEKLIHYVANRFMKRAKMLKVEYEDLVSEGKIGLIKAIQKFNPDYGVKFSTYAVPMIEGQLRRLFRDTNPGLKFSRRAKEIAMKITGNETVKDVMEQFEATQGQAEEALAYKHNSFTISLDQTFSNDDDKDLTIEDTVGYEDDLSNVDIDDFLRVLPPKLRAVAKLIMKDKTQQEIGDKLGCSQVQVSRDIKKIRKLYLDYVKGENKMPRVVFTMSPSEYVDLVSKHTIREVAKIKGISEATLYNWIKVHKEEVNALLSKDETPTETAQKASEKELKVSEIHITTSDKNDEYKAIIDELKAQMESSSSAKDVIIDGLEQKVHYWKQVAEHLEDSNQQIPELQAALNDTQEQMKETALTNLTLGMKVNVLEEQLDEKTKQCQDLQTEYNELLDDYCVLKEEITPLRQLVLINMREKVGILT